MPNADAFRLLQVLIENYETREKNGYTQVLLDDKWQWMHRVIAREKMGSDIYEGFEVHHIDGDKQNNHPDNLKVLSKEEHQAIHDRQKEKKNNIDNDVREYISQRIKRVQAKKNLGKSQFSEHLNKLEEQLITQSANSRLRMLRTILNSQNNHMFDDYFNDDVCTRCGGTGYLPEYNHVEGGVCFSCGGNGRV